MSYRIAYARLLAYEPKALIAKLYRAPDGNHCALGAIASSLLPHGAERCQDFADVLSASGVSCSERNFVRLQNDRFKGTPEARYAHMLAWLAAEVAKEGTL